MITMNGYHSEPEYEEWPKTINKKRWKKYLKRELFEEEEEMIDEYRSEKIMNKRLEDFYEDLDDDFYVPWLSECDGNCLFESLGYYEVGSSVKSLRKGLAHLIYQFRNVKNLFSDMESSMLEMYNEFYEKQYVKYEDEYYEYSFDVMCQDLATDGNWTRLPSEILLKFISLIYNIQIVIVPDNDGKYTCIDSTTDDEVVIVYLGLLNGKHYFPLSLKETDDDLDEDDIKPKFYKESRLIFIKWAKKMEKWVNKKSKEEYFNKMKKDLDKIADLNFT